MEGESFRESVALLYGGYALAADSDVLTLEQFTTLLAARHRVTQPSLVWGLRLAPPVRRALLTPKVITSTAQFVKQCCVAGPPLTANTTVADAHAAYTQWVG